MRPFREGAEPRRILARVQHSKTALLVIPKIVKKRKRSKNRKHKYIINLDAKQTNKNERQQELK